MWIKNGLFNYITQYNNTFYTCTILFILARYFLH
jgi:hypothetical protein